MSYLYRGNEIWHCEEFQSKHSVVFGLTEITDFSRHLFHKIRCQMWIFGLEIMNILRLFDKYQTKLFSSYFFFSIFLERNSSRKCLDDVFHKRQEERQKEPIVKSLIY